MLPPFAVTPLYAALCGLLLLVLALAVVRLRQRHRVNTGDGGHADLARAMRVQANFVEYVPLTLLLLFMLEMSRQPVWALHLLGAGLFVGRVLHAWGYLGSPGLSFGRMVGIVLTLSVLGVTALWLLVVVAQRYLLLPA
ncbi:MAG: MAPEG family protein [Ferrovibrio sp.]|uniref:MAPEG family protein n=1 Tax=Ferrovibrio sp. TaxID=1917215 RepID=UPI002601EA37|nr:MAPEG family protein [Ferrovibrio sp.]MCW0234369.1 MAPEG family protein [Ferrovibrio sp.]